MNAPDAADLTGPASHAVTALEAAWSALARTDRNDYTAVHAACQRVAAAELAVSRATGCPECGAGLGEDCEPYCPEAPRATEEIYAEYVAQMG